jgi:hypothetical protein
MRIQDEKRVNCQLFYQKPTVAQLLANLHQSHRMDTYPSFLYLNQARQIQKTDYPPQNALGHMKEPERRDSMINCPDISRPTYTAIQVALSNPHVISTFILLQRPDFVFISREAEFHGQASFTLKFHRTKKAQRALDGEPLHQWFTDLPKGR